MMVADDYGDLPIDPDEASSLRVHVKACTRRFTALLREIREIRQDQVKERRSRKRAEYIAHSYRVGVIAGLGGIWWTLDKSGALQVVLQRLMGTP